MAVKSVLDVEVRGFDKFTALYAKYEKALKNQPAAWKLVNDKINGTVSSFDKLVAKMAAANVQSKLQVKAQETADKLTRTSAERWAAMARSSKEFATNIKGVTVDLLRWGAITGVISGLLGVGGLFGMERLAMGVAATRRSSFGLGTGYGNQRAFGTNFARLVDPDSFLSSVAGAKLDVTKRVGLLGAGLSDKEIAGDTATTAVTLLRNLKRIADTTNPALYGQVIQARRLDQFVGPEDLQRLRATSPEEFNKLTAGFGRDKGKFDLPADVSRRWQDFTTQLSRAGTGIETVFVKGLAPLVPGLTKLSESVQRAIETLLSSDKLRGWIEKFGEGLETFAKYVGTDEFQENVKGFVAGVGKVASAVAWLVGKLPDGESSARSSRMETLAQKYNQTVWEGVRSGVGSPKNNPGNMRPPNQTTGFMQYPTEEAGLRGMARQLLLYSSRDKLDTVEAIVSKYAPKSENDTKAYIGDVSKRTGFAPNQRLDLSNPETLSRLIAAMVSHEQRPGSFEKYKDAKVVVEVLNNTGGNATVSVNGIKGQ